MTESRVIITADGSRGVAEFQRFRAQAVGALEHVSTAGSVIGKVLGAAGASLSIAAFTGWVKGAIDATDAASDLSQKTGIAIEDLAGMELAFKKGGMEAGALESTMSKLSKQIVDGNDAFDKLGVKTKDASGQFKTNKDMLYELADQFANMEDGVQKTALAQEIFGKSGAAMIPMLNEGSEGLREMDEMARKLGLSLSEEAVEQAGNFNDTLDLLALGGQGVARGIAAELLPTLSNLTGQFLTTMTSGDKLKNTAAFLAAGLKILYTAGVAIVEVFSTVGKTVGAAGAQLVALLQGNFSQAAEIGRMWKEDIGNGWAATLKSIEDAWADSSNASVDSMVNFTRHSTVVGQSAAELAEQSKKTAKAQQEEAKALAQLAGLTGTFADEWKELSSLYAKGRINLEQLTKAQGDLLAKQPAMKAAAEEEVAARKLLVESAEQYEKAYDLAAAAKAKAVAGLQAQKDENEQIGLGALALAELNATRMESQALRAEENAEIAEGLDLTGQLAQQYRDEAEALRALAGEQRNGARKKIAVDEAKSAEESWKRGAENIEKSLTDALLRGFESGQSIGENLISTLKNMFNTLVLRPIIQAVVQPVSNQINGLLGQVTSSTGSGGGKTGTPAAGGGSGMLSGGAVSVAGWIAAGMAASDALYKQGWDARNGSISSYGPAAPFNAPMLHLNKLLGGLGMDSKLANMFSGASTVARLFGRKNPEIESQGLRGTFSGSGFSGDAYANIVEKGGLFRSTKRYEQSAPLSAAQDASFDATFKGLLDAAKGFASTLGLEASVIDGYNKQIKLELGADEAKNQEAIAKLFGDIGDELSLRLVPGLSSFALAGETASATLQRLVGDYATVDEALNAIGMQFDAVGVASLSARERLIEASGGVEAFAANTAGFQQNFLSQTERNAPVLAAVTGQLAALGLAGVDTRDEFKQVVLGLDLTTEAGAKQYGSLMKLQAAFAQVYPAIEDTATALAQVNEGYQEQIDEILRGRMSQDELRAADIQGMDASTVALYDRLAGLQRESSMLDERAALQAEINQLTMTEEQLLARKRDELDPANRAMWDQIQAIRAQQKASEDAAAAAGLAIQAAREAAAQTMRIQQEMVRSLGDAFQNSMLRAEQAAASLRKFNAELLLGDLSPLDTEAQYREAKRLFEAADPSDTAAATAFLQASKARDVDSYYYERDFAAVQVKIATQVSDLEKYMARLPGFYQDLIGSYLSAPVAAPAGAVAAPAAQTQGAMSKSSAAEVTTSQRAERALVAIAESTQKFADQFEKVSNGGNELEIRK